MTGSTPQDVATAFRSFPRRLTAVLAGAEDDTDRLSAGPLVSQLDGLIRTTARSFGVTDQGDLPAVVAKLADSVEDLPADQWTPTRLDDVREAALAGGRLLRQIEAQLSR